MSWPRKMSRASFLDRTPGVSLASAFGIWIRWWFKRKLKRNPVSFSAAVARPPLRSTSRRAIPVWALNPAIVLHERFQTNVPRGNGATSTREQLRGKQHRHWSISCSSLPPARALRPSHGSCRYFGEQIRFVSHRGNSISRLCLSCPPNELHAQCRGRGRRLPYELRLGCGL
jgi:hypothetical protein